MKPCACGGSWPDNHRSGCLPAKMSKLWPSAYAEELTEPRDPNYDPTPWCTGCGARRQRDCDCGPIAENN